MSNSEPNLEESSAQLLVTHQSTLKSLAEEIDSILHEQLIEHPDPSYEDLNAALQYLFQNQISQEESEGLARSLLFTLSEPDVLKTDAADDLNQDVDKFLRVMLVHYQSHIQKVSLRNNQGREYWTTVDWELVVRGTRGTPGINYEIWKGDRRVDLSVSFKSAMGLILNLLDSYHSAMEMIDTADYPEQFDKETIESVIQLAEEINEVVVEKDQ